MEFVNKEALCDYIKQLDNDVNVYIFGTGIYGDLLGKLFNDEGISWNGYIDNFPNNENEKINNMPVYNGNNFYFDTRNIYILSMRNYSCVKEQLIKNHISFENIIWFDKVTFFNELDNGNNYSEEYSFKIQSLKNIYENQKCFIIGNGPSLKIEDLNKISEYNYCSFGSNHIYKCFNNTRWRPDYYFFTDPTGIRETLSKEQEFNIIASNCKILFTRNIINFDKSSDNNVILINQVYSPDEENMEFSSDVSKCFYIGYSVTYIMLQMAVYMGFKEIYLLGMDHSYSIETVSIDGDVKIEKNIKDHSDILGNAPMWGVANIYKINKGYEAAKKYADDHNIKIYNSTRGGKLEVFERLDFDRIFTK